MPEGPEVKIAADYFNNFFSNSKKLEFVIITDYYLEKYNDVFTEINKRIKELQPMYVIGKNLFLNIDKELIFNFHLGMTGGWSNKLVKHCHFYISDGSKKLYFKDVRKFGKMRIINQLLFASKFVDKFDLLNKEYDSEKHIDFLNKKIIGKKSICSILMNQGYFPGVGNYIKSESLYASKLHPEKPWKSMSKWEKINLIQTLRNIMYKSYISGGAELKDFKNPFSKSKFKLKIYGKKFTSKKDIVTSKITSDYRKTWFCTKSQKL